MHAYLWRSTIYYSLLGVFLICNGSVIHQGQFACHFVRQDAHTSLIGVYFLSAHFRTIRRA